MRSLSLAELLTMGWQLHPTLGLRKRGFTSVAFEFFWEDIRIGAVQGYGNTVETALADAVIWANHWLQEQPSPALGVWLAKMGRSLVAAPRPVNPSLALHDGHPPPRPTLPRA